MADDLSDIAAYYNGDPAREHARLERHQLEYELTWRYLDRFLPPRGTILEVGAATGRYTLALARRGYRVTAVDLSADLLEIGRENIQQAGLEQQVRFIVADARDLGQVLDKDFDAALIMGPLYHLILAEDRIAALAQVYQRLKPGGIVVSAFISRFGILGDLMRDVPAWIEDREDVRALLANGQSPEGAPRGGFRGYFARVEEIEPLHEAVGFETLVVAGSEPAISADDESYNRLEGTQRQLWLDLLFEVSREPSTLAASRHLLYVGQKSGGA